MNDHFFIVGDWGTSRLRVYLCDEDTVKDTKTGPGISKLTQSPGDTLLEVIDSWRRDYGILPIYLAGMVGSNIGWIETPYVSCPVTLETFKKAKRHLVFEGHDIHIAGGVEAVNPLGSPDFMRGEEIQIFGALRLYPELKFGRHLLCLPGTHTKWVNLKNGEIQSYHTALTGELFDMLSRHSILVKDRTLLSEGWEAAFTEGVRRSLELQETALLHSLFEIRARQLKGSLPADQATATLSGYLIGRDVFGALRLYTNQFDHADPITIIGVSTLTTAYRIAIEASGSQGTERDGALASLAGLRAFYSR